MQRLVYVLPVHQEELVLARNVERLLEHLAHLPTSVFASSEIILVANGCTDASASIARGLEGDAPVRVRAFEEKAAGLGIAYHRGLVEALAGAHDREHTWAVLTASDLPFGFSDVEAAMVPMERATTRIIVGSKAHEDSRAPTGPTRTAMSYAYRVARRALVGMKVGDSQGSVFVRLDLAADLVTKIQSRDFFYSTELCHYAERVGETILEVPVLLEPSGRPSTVKPLRHGLAMARQLVALRWRDR